MRVCACVQLAVNVIDHGNAHYKEQLRIARRGVMVSEAFLQKHNYVLVQILLKLQW